jgi:hypothetical protein
MSKENARYKKINVAIEDRFRSYIDASPWLLIRIGIAVTAVMASVLLN